MLAPITILLIERITRGLWFDLDNHYRQNKDNPFRRNFGLVFQEYVGFILKKFLGEDFVKSEFKYGSSSKSLDSIDWIILKDNQAVFIEVKYSCLYLNSKLWGEQDEIEQNLKKTIGKRVNQLKNFNNNIKSNKYPELNYLKNLDSIGRVIITYDSSYYLNSFCRNLIRQSIHDIDDNFHWHTISIDDLEDFLGYTQNSFFDSLREKRNNPDWDSMDFHNYCCRRYPKDQLDDSIMSSLFDLSLSELGINFKNK